MKNLGRIFPLLMAAEMMGNLDNYSSGKSSITPEKIDVTPKKKPIPKGCKKYEFEYMGGLFSCIALNEKSAKKKFNNWRKNLLL
jgi:hypothetical protein